MLREWERKYPGRIDNMLHAMGHVAPSHLMDRNLYPFATLQATGVADADGDKAFDDDEACASPAAVQFSVKPMPAVQLRGLQRHAGQPSDCRRRWPLLAGRRCAASARRSSSQPLSLLRAACRCAAVVLLCSCATKAQLYSVSRCW